MTPGTEDDDRDAAMQASALFDALRAETVQCALDDIEADTGLARERIIAEAVVFAGQERRAFLAHLRGRPSHQRKLEREPRRRRFLSENAVQMLVGGMFLLGVALAAIEMLLR